ncbi:MAG: pyridoxamine 5'-phosphate oxidase family protein [Firmicutes bacterium]|nr:pyridoxamine 5'-phosphate oxidase family protein [Bacillota bacterium]
MEETLKFLQQNAPFYVATLEDDQPKVRPFGFVMEHEGKLWFCTSNQKKIYRQLQKNPYFEVCTASPERVWVRVTGRAVFQSTPALKEKALEAAPLLKKMYSVDDNIFELFYLAEGEAFFCSMSAPPRRVKL